MVKSCKEIIEARKSVRKFENTEIDDNLILEILDSARLAPSAKNRQPWKYYILNDQEKTKVIDLFQCELKKDNSEETGLATSRIMTEANKIVLVFMDTYFLTENNLSPMPYYLSMGASIENALLRATELGIGSLWICDILAIEKQLTEMFYPNGKLISALCFGYAKQENFRAKKKELKQIIIKKEEIYND